MTRYRPPAKIDLEEAQRMLDAGESVLTIALTFQVAQQSVYEHITAGRLVRPAKATRGADSGDGGEGGAPELGGGEPPPGAGAEAA